MAEDKVKHIHIEDGDAEEKEQQAANAADGSPEGSEQTEGSADETCSERAGGTEEGEGQETSGDSTADGEPDKKDPAAAEEQESERYMRLMAEFQNFKRRAAREKSDIHAYANEKIVGELLPVLDNFERALATDAVDAEGYAKGMELIFQQLKTALEHAGLAEIAALGEEFDPNLHNAVMTEQSEEHEDGKVSKVLQKGYKLNDKVIRPSMVAVVRN